MGDAAGDQASVDLGNGNVPDGLEKRESRNTQRSRVRDDDLRRGGGVERADGRVQDARRRGEADAARVFGLRARHSKGDTDGGGLGRPGLHERLAVDARGLLRRTCLGRRGRGVLLRYQANAD